MTAFLFGILVGFFLGASIVSILAIRKIEAMEDMAYDLMRRAT